MTYLGAAVAALLLIALIWAVGPSRRGSPAKPNGQRVAIDAGRRQMSGPGNGPQETAGVPPPPPSHNPLPQPPETPAAVNPAPPRETSQPEVAQPPPQSPVSVTASGGSQTIDLLALVEPAKHSASGAWELCQSGLATVRKGEGFNPISLILPPVIPEGSFELETEFTMLKGEHGAGLLFPIGNSFALVEFGAFGGRFSGLAVIDGRGTGDSNNPTSRPCTVRTNVRYKMAVRVQYFGDNQVKISATLDGDTLFRWQGPVSAVSSLSLWPMSSPARIGLGTAFSSIVFHTARLRMLDGQAKTPEGKILVAAAATGRPEEKAHSPSPAEVAKPVAEVAKPVAKVADRPTEPPPVPPEPEKTEPSAAEAAEKLKRLAVPSEASQKEALAIIEETYRLKDATKPAAKAKLAKELFDLAEKTQGRPGEQFTLLRTAAELATGAGEMELMSQAVDAIGEAFAVDPLSIKCKLAGKASSGISTSTAIGAFIEAADGLTQQAVAEDRYDLAEGLNAAAGRLAQKGSGKQYLKVVRERQQEIERLGKQWEAIQEALETLKAHPDDAESNSAAGRWYCFRKGDWDKGLPYLAKGGDDRLKKVAQQELDAPPKEAADQLQLADDWWALSQHDKDDKEALASARANGTRRRRRRILRVSRT